MGRYAAQTTVPVERTRTEIEETLRRYNATEFHSGWNQNAAMIAFRMEGLFIRFVLPLPDRSEQRFRFKYNTRRGCDERRTDQATMREYDQEIRQRWRALLLAIKGKLEAIEIGISTVEREFLSFIVMPDDKTLGEWLAFEVLPAIRENRMPQLGYKGHDVTDAEFEEKQ